MRRALIAGIDGYAGVSLHSCVNDANAMAEVLETHGNGSPNFHVRLMTSPSEDITKAVLREAIERLFATECDIVLLCFSGHGYAEERRALCELGQIPTELSPLQLPS